MLHDHEAESVGKPATNRFEVPGLSRTVLIVEGLPRICDRLSKVPAYCICPRTITPQNSIRDAPGASSVQILSTTLILGCSIVDPVSTLRREYCKSVRPNCTHQFTVPATGSAPAGLTSSFTSTCCTVFTSDTFEAPLSQGKLSGAKPSCVTPFPNVSYLFVLSQTKSKSSHRISSVVLM